jgi:hypothetical protein
VKRVVPVKDLHQILQGERSALFVTRNVLSADYARKGFAIDALVASVAQGWELAKNFNV